MKVVISRKGFDSANGGVPSPIMPDGRLVPLPIPASNDPTTYAEVQINGVEIAELVEDLTARRLSRDHSCHLDPDLDQGSLPRQPGWRQSLGQIDSAQGHLAKQNVGAGDLFLFFGWFRQVEKTPQGWRFVTGSPDRHILFGWLRIGQIVYLGRGQLPSPLPAFKDHPHLHGRDRSTNTLYLAKERLDLNAMDVPGAGLFHQITNSRILTDPSQKNRSLWRLPLWMHPDGGSTLTYHIDTTRWRRTTSGCTAQSVAKGQEFVLRANDPEALRGWINDLFTD